jgi:hypothetical protein
MILMFREYMYFSHQELYVLSSSFSKEANLLEKASIEESSFLGMSTSRKVPGYFIEPAPKTMSRVNSG